MIEADEHSEAPGSEGNLVLPRLPKGKKMVDTVVATDVDSLFKSVFENDTFFEIVGSKSYEQFRNYRCSPWMENRESGLLEREMR